MKRILSIQLFLALCGIALFSSCNSYKSPLDTKIDDIVFNSFNNFTVYRLGDLSNCRIESSEDWCHAYSRKDSLVVAVEQNYSYDDRTALVNATDDEDGTKLSFKVTQLHRNAIFTDSLTYNVAEEGGIVTILVWSNVDYSVDLRGTEWISISQNATRGLENTTINLLIAKNESGDEREAEIGITDPETGLTQEVTIRQDFYGYVIPDRDYLEVDKAGGEVAFTVKANIPFKVESAYSWVKAGPQTKTATNTYSQTLQIEPLPEGYANRRCVIYVGSTNNKIYNMLTISQSGQQP